MRKPSSVRTLTLPEVPWLMPCAFISQAGLDDIATLIEKLYFFHVLTSFERLRIDISAFLTQSCPLFERQKGIWACCAGIAVVDAGKTNTKVMLFDVNGKPLAEPHGGKRQPRGPALPLH